MKILHVITNLQMGGAEKLMTLLLPKLKHLGVEVEILLLDGTDTPIYQELHSKGIVIHSLGNMTNVYHPLYLIRLIRFLRIHRYDVVHTHNTAPQFFVAVAHLFNKKIKLFTTEHSTSNRRRNLKCFRSIDRWMYHQYDGVICISDQAEINLRNHLQQSYNNITTIYNGVDIMKIANTLPDEKIKGESKRFIVTMVARMVDAKDQDTLIRAISHLSKEDFELWLVGDGPRRPILESLVKDLRLEDCVKFWGVRTDVPVLLKTSDIIVMSSHYEGLSLSNIEGMAANKPFVASNVDGIKEVTEGAGLLFPHEDDQYLANILLRLKNDTTLYNSVASSCFTRAKKYDISFMAEKYLQLYTKFL